MIFPAEDRVLLAQELGTYGITYTETYDCLVVAPGLKGHPDRVGSVSGISSPLETVCLLAFDGECVGVLFPAVSELIYCFWNGKIPDETPAEYIADMIDLSLGEVRSQIVIDSLVLCQTRAMHEYARELVQESGFLPEVILERIREHIGTFKEILH